MLKLDPKNTELLSQKQEVLNKSIETTEEKLEQLKEIKAKADEAMANGTEINEENYRNLQREIIATQNKLSDLKNENSKFTKFGDWAIKFGDNLDKIGKKIDSLGSKLTTRLSVPIATAFGASVKEAIEFESAFTGVEKTVEGTEEQMKNLKQGIKDLAKEIPSSTTEIAAVAEAAGQLGIETDNILSFSKAMIDLGNSTNLSSEEAASQLARFANITKMSQKDFDKLGSSIVDLGNNFATTEADIVNMAMRLAGAGTQVGMSQGQILGLATALSSVGIEAEMGGSAISKAMVKMQNAVELGGGKLEDFMKTYGFSLQELELMAANQSTEFKEMAQEIGMTSTELKNMVTAGVNLRDFAEVAGMSADEFKKAWKEDATGALSAFIQGLGNAEDKGESAITMLSEMGLTEVRLRDSLLRAANASGLFNKAIKTGSEAFEENVALTKEANKRYKTTESQLKIAKNKIKDVAISLGDKLLPAIIKILDKVGKWVEKLDDLSDSQKENIVKIGLLVAAAGPALKLIGSGISTIGTITKGIGTFSQAIALAHNGIGTATGSAADLAKVLQGLTSPAGLATLAIAGITAGVIAMIAKIKESEEKTNKAFETMGTAASDYIDGINKANSHLDEFNRTLFVSSEEQQKLEEEMNEVQQGITKICKAASEERRDYTQEEITQLDSYFEKLRTLNQRELEIEQSIAKAISQQAITTAETFKGTLEEYKEQSQEWIKTAEDQKEKEIELINSQTTEEIALLNQRFGDKADLSNEAYKQEYEKIINQKEENIKQVEEEIASVTQKYAEGYLERAKQNEGFYTKIEEVHLKEEKETERYNKALELLENQQFLTEGNKMLEKSKLHLEHERNMKSIWTNTYKNMSDSQKEQLGSWLAMVSDTEVQGGKLDEETQKVVDEILNSFDKIPEDSKKIMGQTMQGMMDGMQEKEPSLFKKATNIADGVLSRLKKTFDIGSPSKETRDIFRYVMKGAELGLEDERKKLDAEVDKISDEVLKHFNVNVGFNNGMNNKIIDSTKTVFTTPQITFNVQKMNKENLDECFKYINRKFGSAY